MPGNYRRRDRLYEQAKSRGYRSRASFKLLELHRRFKIFHKGQKVLDLGCAPGGWLQIALSLVGEDGRVVGVDLERVEPLSEREMSQIGVKRPPSLLQADVTDRSLQLRLGDSGSFDVVLSDMSPRLSGIAFRDAFLSAELAGVVLKACENLLSPGGSVVAKIFPGEETEELAGRFEQRFAKFSRVRLEASRNTSKEMYFVGLSFRG